MAHDVHDLGQTHTIRYLKRRVWDDVRESGRGVDDDNAADRRRCLHSKQIAGFTYG